MNGSDENEDRRERVRRATDREDALLHHNVGELMGRMAAAERDLAQLSTRLESIDDHLQRLSRRMAWFGGGIAFILPMLNFVAWYMVVAGVGPFEDAAAKVKEPPAIVEPKEQDKK